MSASRRRGSSNLRTAVLFFSVKPELDGKPEGRAFTAQGWHFAGQPDHPTIVQAGPAAGRSVGLACRDRPVEQPVVFLVGYVVRL
jgi:hypothetical protein